MDNPDEVFYLRQSVLFVFTCAGCHREYIEEIANRKSKLKDLVCICAQYIWQEKYQELKVEEHVMKIVLRKAYRKNFGMS